MPCACDYPDPTRREIELSHVRCLLEEVATGRAVDSQSVHWRGEHPQVYGKNVSETEADSLTRRLCDHLSAVGAQRYSLEMQVWWRDHQKADRARAMVEAEAKEVAARRQLALDKLSDDDRAVLGLDGR